MNKSGWTPVEYKVIVKPIEVEEKTKGGIILPQETKDTEFLAQADGILVDKTDMAFSFGVKNDGSIDYWASDIPKVGDTVKYAKYAGRMIKGDDNVDYRIINDKDIIAIRRKT